MAGDYQVGAIWRAVSRFVYPIYLEQMGNFTFSSTVSFVRFSHSYYAIFAAHAIEGKNITFENVRILGSDSKFAALSKFTDCFHIFEQHDLVICRLNQHIENRFYFNLEQPCLHRDAFGWVGFPAKKAVKQYHNSKVKSGSIGSVLTEVDGDIPKINNARFLVIGAKLHASPPESVAGEFSLDNADYEVDGTKTRGYSPQGMSGGALFQVNSDMINSGTVDDIFVFFGIGLSYDGRLVKGASKDLIVSLIKKF